MRAVRAVVMALILVAVVAGAIYAQDEGATFTFTDTKTLVYEGTGEMRAENRVELPVTVGNFRITNVRLPSQSNRDYVGLVFPFRGALNERMVDLDPRWDGAEPLVLVCEVVDPDLPIGFRMRAHGRVRMRHSPGAWLELNLGRGPQDDEPIPATEQNKRFSGGTHLWYCETTIDDIYRLEDPEPDRFTLMLDTGERGSWWIKWLQIKPWPTVMSE